MSAQSTNQLGNVSTSQGGKKSEREFEVVVTSFGYKNGPPPPANVVFDVRFLKNPYWVEELRPLTGLDEPVQRYVLEQKVAIEFLDSITDLLGKIIPRFAELKPGQFVVALGCTGGQHRSATLVEVLTERLALQFPQYKVHASHRELGQKNTAIQAESSQAR